jgi:hypothetical protein
MCARWRAQGPVSAATLAYQSSLRHTGKMLVLEKMLHILYHEKKERIVLISNYTQVIRRARRSSRHLAWHLLLPSPHAGISPNIVILLFIFLPFILVIAL